MNNDNPGSGQRSFSIRRLLDRVHPNPESGHSVLVVVGSAAVIVLAINLALVAWALKPEETPGVIPPEKTDLGTVSAPPATPLKYDEITGLPAITGAVTHGTPDCAYVEVAFATPLETNDLERYASIGLDLYDRIDRHTWYACLMGNADEFAEAHQEINRIDVIQSESKIAEQLKLDRTPLEHERRTGGRVAYSVLFHKDVDFQQAQSMADSMRFELEDVEGGLFNTLGVATVIVPEGRILALAGVDIIARIEPIDTPEAPTNQERGQPLSKVDKVQEDPIGLDGSGVTVGIWEAGGTVLAEHLDLTGRVVIEAGQTSRKSGHATHVAGTIGSSGAYISAAEGMAPNSRITSWDARSDHQEMLLSGKSINSDEEPDPVLISNHSYGLCTGWNGCTRGWLPNDNFGAYTIHAGVLDRVIAESGIISTWSAGNSQNYGPPGNTDPNRPNNCTAHQYDEFQHAPDVFADCINAENGAKNVITVAAMRNAGSVASFSSYGPMDDGRIKPDLAAQGNPLLSTVPGNTGQVCVGQNGGAPCASAYSGTSMSSPLVAGVAALVIQDVLEQADDPFRRIATRMTPEGMKALLIQTAQDVSGFDQANPGPDYATGWGIVDAEAAIGLLRKGGLIQGGLEDTGLAGAWTQPMVVPPGQPEIHVTLAWTDPPGNPAAEKALVNDLDLRLISPDGTEFTPWVLAGMADPTLPAVRNGGNDSINNVEQVSVLSPKPGDWQVVVKADRGNMPSPQNFAVAGVLPIEPGTLVSPIRTAPSAGPVRIGTPPTPSLACPMDDTEIVFNKISESGNDLWKVNSDCEYTQLTDTAAGGGHDGAWSPDGRKIAFGSVRDGNSEIYVMNADGSGQTRLTFSDSSDIYPSWSPDGKKIVFASSRIGRPRTPKTVWDIHVLEVARPNNADNQYPPKALTQAGNSDNPRFINGFPDWSPDGDRIAFSQTSQVGHLDLYLMDTDGGNLTRVTDNQHSYFPQWSPDGKKLVFQVVKEGSQSVWVVGTDGNDLRRLTDDESNNGTASWSPDGKQIAFASDRDGTQDLYMMDADGSNVRRITNDGSQDWLPNWSSFLSQAPTPSLACPMDDTEIVFNKMSESGNDLWKVNSDCEYTQLTDTAAAGEGDGAWSPDGKKIAFVSERDGNSEIYVMNADGYGQTRLTFDDGEDRFPTWSPDGRYIVFTSPRIGGPGTYDIHVLEVAKPNNADNQNPPKALTQAGSSNAPMLINGSPDWSPDGDRIAFTSTRDGDYELYLMDTDGGNVTRITDNEHTDYLPQWSPDGKKIVFTVEKEGRQSVWVVGSDGDDLRRLTDDESDNGSASWSPDGKQITFASDRDGSTKLYMMDADGSNVRRMTQARQ